MHRNECSISYIKNTVFERKKETKRMEAREGGEVGHQVHRYTAKFRQIDFSLY